MGEELLRSQTSQRWWSNQHPEEQLGEDVIDAAEFLDVTEMYFQLELETYAAEGPRRHFYIKRRYQWS